MEVGITDRARSTLLRAAVAKVGRDELKGALARSSQAVSQAPRAVGNALNALRKHGDPTRVVDRGQYRVALPYLAAVISDECLARAIEVLGEHSDDPTRQQLLDALDRVGETFSDVTIAVMLASVASGDMPASDLCFDIAANDERFGLADWAEFASTTASAQPASPGRPSPTPEQREARRLKKQIDADERRKKMEAAPAGRRTGPTGQETGATPPGRRLRSTNDWGRRAGPRGGPPTDQARRAHPRPGGGIRSERSLDGGCCVRLGAVRFPRPDPTGPRGQVAALRGGGGVTFTPVGPTRLLRGRCEEPRLEVGADPPVETSRVRPAHLDRRGVAPSTAQQHRPDWLAGGGRLERPLVRPGHAAHRCGVFRLGTGCLGRRAPERLLG